MYNVNEYLSSDKTSSHKSQCDTKICFINLSLLFTLLFFALSITVLLRSTN